MLTRLIKVRTEAAEMFCGECFFKLLGNSPLKLRGSAEQRVRATTPEFSAPSGSSLENSLTAALVKIVAVEYAGRRFGVCLQSLFLAVLLPGSPLRYRALYAAYLFALGKKGGVVQVTNKVLVWQVVF